jgi:hypothetical protein
LDDSKDRPDHTWIQDLLRGTKMEAGTGFGGGPWRAGRQQVILDLEWWVRWRGRERRFFVRKVLYKLASRMLLFLCYSSRLHVKTANLSS